MARRPTGIKGIVHDLDHAGEPVRILPLSDLHYGDPHADEKLIKSLIDRIATDPACYTVLVGDLLNTALIGSKSDAKAEKHRITDQVLDMAELLEPIKGRILAAVPGNHEERAYRMADADLTELIMGQLGLRGLYRPTSAYLFVKTGRNAHGGRNIYSIFINHGHGGGGRRPGSKVNNLDDFSTYLDVDVIVSGHNHQPAVLTKSKIRSVPQTGTFEPYEQVLVSLGSALTYAGSYGERGGFQPGSNRFPLITLEGDRKYAHATL